MRIRLCLALALVPALGLPAQAAPATYDDILNACGAAMQICMTSCGLAGRPGFDLRRVLCEAECDDAYSRCVGTDDKPPVASKGRTKGQTMAPVGGVFDPGGGGSLSAPVSGEGPRLLRTP